MGRFVKNTRVVTIGGANYGAVMPSGPTSLRPTNPVPGDFRFNTDTTAMEIFYSGLWNTIPRIGLVTITKDDFYGDAVTLAFNMSKSYSPGQEKEIIVVVGNVFQNPGVAYTVNGSTINFTSAPPAGQAVFVLHGFAATGTTASTSIVA